MGGELVIEEEIPHWRAFIAETEFKEVRDQRTGKGGVLRIPNEAGSL